MRRGVALALALALPGAALGQPLPPAPPLTSLIRPQPLDRSAPLVPGRAATPAAGADRNRAGGTPCERQSAGSATSGAGRPGGRSLAYGGAGPGEFAQYTGAGGAAGAAAAPAGRAATPAGGAAASPSGSPGSQAAGRAGGEAAQPPGKPVFDRPLYGGVDRPLWGTPNATRADGPATANEAGSRADPLTDAGTGPSAGADPAPRDPDGLPLRDRPLWADGSSPPAPTVPCSEGASPRRGAAWP